MNQKHETALAPPQQASLAEVDTSHAEALARAEVEAAHLAARRFPRDMDQVREDLLKDCRRPAFAAEARYLIPIGEGIQGWSIRFVEAAIGHMGNIATGARPTFIDEEKEVLQVAVTDYQRNVSHQSTATVAKVVETLKLRKGQKPISSRRNSQGRITHLVAADEQRFRAKKGSEVSKHIRTNGERLIPAWLKEEALTMVRETMAQKDAEDPDAARRQLADAFAEIGVKVSDLKRYLDHDFDQASPAELEHLRAVFTTVRDGQYSWAECLKARLGEDAQPEGSDPHAALKKDLAKKVASSKKRRTKPKAKASQPKAEAPPADSQPQQTEEQRLIEQGWEVDGQTGELVPPPGWSDE